MLRVYKKLFLITVPCLFIFSSFFVFASYSEVPESLPAEQKIKELEGVGIQEKLGSNLDLSLQFTDEQGQKVSLSHYFDGIHPVILSPVYFDCPGLCNFHLNGLFEGFQKIDWTAGEQFTVLAISFDSRESTLTANQKRETYLNLYNRQGADKGVHFLTGDEPSVKALTQSIGFKYRWVKETNEWAHSSSAIIASPSGKIVRYLPGIVFEPKDLKFALNESTNGKIGSFVDALVLYCFQYNPHKSGYSLAAFKLMRLGGLIAVLVLSIFMLLFWSRVRKEHKQVARSSS